jgi:hypothetical protein
MPILDAETLHRASLSPNGRKPNGAVGRVDLGPIVRGEQADAVPTIVQRDDGGAVFYAGALHDLHAEPGTGKTWLELYAGADILRSGSAFAFLDYEGTAATFVTRLRALRVPGDVIADQSRVAYHNLVGKTSPDVVELLVEQFTEMDVALVGLDSMLPALIRNGWDDNSNADLAAFYELFARPLTANGAALVCTDHMTKDSATRARGARGASAKLQLVDVSYSLKTLKPFSRDRAGTVRITCAKDRFGTFAIGQTVADIHVAPNVDFLDLDVRAPEERDPDAPFRPTVLMERISRALEDHGDEMGANELRLAVRGDDKTKPVALQMLVNEGYVARRPHGQRVLHQSIRPFRQDNDDRG